MDNDSKKEVVNGAKALAPFFEIEISVRVLGQTIWHYVFPPKNKSK